MSLFMIIMDAMEHFMCFPCNSFKGFDHVMNSCHHKEVGGVEVSYCPYSRPGQCYLPVPAVKVGEDSGMSLLIEPVSKANIEFSLDGSWVGSKAANIYNWSTVKSDFYKSEELKNIVFAMHPKTVVVPTGYFVDSGCCLSLKIPNLEGVVVCDGIDVKEKDPLYLDAAIRAIAPTGKMYSMDSKGWFSRYREVNS